MPDIFLSYSREDQAVARRFAESLEREGFSVWWDQSLAAGEEFDAVTEKSLDEAKAVVVLWSKHSVSSRWVRAEATQGQANHRLVPVMIEPCRRPIMFELTHTAELSHWSGDPQDASWRSFVTGLYRFAQKEPSVNPVAAHPAMTSPGMTSPAMAETTASGQRVATEAKATKSRNGARIAAVAGVLLVLVAAAYGLRQLGSSGQPQSAVPLAQSLTELSQLVQKDSYEAAFTLGNSMLASADAKSSPEFQKLWQQVVLPMKPLVSEAGATVYFRPHDGPVGPWIKAGTTPLAQTLPAPRGILSVRVEKPGFRTGSFVVANPGPSVENDTPGAFNDITPVPLPLVADGALPADMVLVPHTNMPVPIGGLTTGFNGGLPHDIPAFAISRTEVSNREFKEFVDAGGYDNPSYWQGMQFRDGGRELSWNQARARFLDATQRPAPAGWQLGSYPEGQADLPVGGISWYEAMAYARYRGKMLPTVHHWARASQGPYDFRYGVAVAVALTGRFNAAGPVPVQTEAASGPWGTVNATGNVREWVVNFAGSNAMTMGGAWSDYAQLGLQAFSAPPMQRLPENGMRLMQLLPGAVVEPDLLQPLPALAGYAVATRQKPVGEEAFEAIRFQFTAGHGEPDKVTVEQVETSPLWVAEEVRLEFKGQQSEVFYIFRPSGRRGPLQPVIYGPPGDCCLAKRPNRDALRQLRSPADAVVRSGRALVLPIWEGGYERYSDPAPADAGKRAQQLREQLLALHQTLGDVLDYLEKVPDIDSRQVGYLGMSSGSAYIAPSVLALEGRIRAAVLVSGGLARSGESMPSMLDNATYLPRIRIPTLMINGRFDHLFLLETSQKRMYELLGTPAAQKKQILYDVGHVGFPSNSIARDIGDWYDRYLGTPR